MAANNYNSFLICDHEEIVAIYSNGIELAIFHKKKKQLEIKTRDPAKLKLAENIFFQVALTLEVNELMKEKKN